MRIGDIILVSGKSFISKMIQKVTGSKWTHVAIYIGKGNILEADWYKRASIVPNMYTEGWDHIVLRTKTPLTKTHQRRLLYAAQRYNHTRNKYDWGMILALLIRCKFPNSRLVRMLNNRNNYICTELVDAVYREIGIDLFPTKGDDIFPYEFMELDKLRVVDEQTILQEEKLIAQAGNSMKA